MPHNNKELTPLSPELAAIITALVSIGLLLGIDALIKRFVVASDRPAITSIGTPQVIAATSTTPAQVVSTPTSATLASTLTPTPTGTPTNTPTATPTPTPTLDLMTCNAAGCGAEAIPLPTIEYNTNLLLRFDPPQRRLCPGCPQNEQLTSAELNALIGVDPATFQQLRRIALSQTPYQIAPGLVYIVSDDAHHVVVDLQEPGLKFRNIIPPIPDEQTRANIRITPSYCLTPNSLLVMTADYHGLVGSNKTEEGRELFFHLGRATLFERDGEFDLDVIREHPDFARASISWGGGPIFMWDGEYDFDPEQEWFTPENLEHYRTSRWAKLTVAVSKDRKYLFISTSFGLTLEEHAENIVNLGERWGIEMDRAMRFDGSESAYIAIRMGDFMVPMLSLEEPLIVNCLAIEEEVISEE